MWLFNFYRLYVSVAAGAAIYFFLFPRWWIWLLVTIAARGAWHAIEFALDSWQTGRDFARHISSFRQEYGPYGIRIANKAGNDRRVKKSLAEVFTSNGKKLRKTVEQLEVMDTLFKAGMRPEADEYLLHDLKLKYGKLRLEKEI